MTQWPCLSLHCALSSIVAFLNKVADKTLGPTTVHHFLPRFPLLGFNFIKVGRRTRCPTLAFITSFAVTVWQELWSDPTTSMKKDDVPPTTENKWSPTMICSRIKWSLQTFQPPFNGTELSISRTLIHILNCPLFVITFALHFYPTS